MTKKTLFVHIGSHKTATTFLQSSLSRNEKALNELSLIYPKAGRIHEAHFKLGWQIKKMAAHQPLTGAGDWGNVIEEINASKARAGVVSSEELGIYCDPNKLSDLKKNFDVRIICYLRSPDGFMQSFYNQFIKDFSTRETRTLNTYIAEEELGFLNTRQWMSPWIDVFGAKAISLRLFDDVVRAEGGILTDFLKVCGAKKIPTFNPPQVSVVHKVSLPPDLLEYLRRANAGLAESEGHYQFVVRLLGLAEKHGDALQTTRAGILSLKARQTLRKRYAGPNTWIANALLNSNENPFLWKDAPLPPSDFDQRPEEADAATLGRIAALIQNNIEKTPKSAVG